MQSTSHFSKLIEAAAMVSQGNGLGEETTGNANLFISTESASRTVFLADLPRTTSYLDLSEYFEEKVGPCVIAIKR